MFEKLRHNRRNQKINQEIKYASEAIVDESIESRMDRFTTRGWARINIGPSPRGLEQNYFLYRVGKVVERKSFDRFGDNRVAYSHDLSKTANDYFKIKNTLTPVSDQDNGTRIVFELVPEEKRIYLDPFATNQLGRLGLAN